MSKVSRRIRALRIRQDTQETALNMMSNAIEGHRSRLLDVMGRLDALEDAGGMGAAQGPSGIETANPDRPSRMGPICTTRTPVLHSHHETDLGGPRNIFYSDPPPRPSGIEWTSDGSRLEGLYRVIDPRDGLDWEFRVPVTMSGEDCLALEGIPVPELIDLWVKLRKESWGYGIVDVLAAYRARLASKLRGGEEFHLEAGCADITLPDDPDDYPNDIRVLWDGPESKIVLDSCGLYFPYGGNVDAQGLRALLRMGADKVAKLYREMRDAGTASLTSETTVMDLIEELERRKLKLGGLAGQVARDLADVEYPDVGETMETSPGLGQAENEREEPVLPKTLARALKLVDERAQYHLHSSARIDNIVNDLKVHNEGIEEIREQIKDIITRLDAQRDSITYLSAHVPTKSDVSNLQISCGDNAEQVRELKSEVAVLKEMVNSLVKGSTPKPAVDAGSGHVYEKGPSSAMSDVVKLTLYGVNDPGGKHPRDLWLGPLSDSDATTLGIKWVKLTGGSLVCMSADGLKTAGRDVFNAIVAFLKEDRS